MNAVVTIPNNIPAHLRGRIGQPSVLGDSLKGGLPTGETFPRISIKGSRFRVVEGEKEEVIDATYIDVIIVGANPRLSKTYYAKKWDPDAEATAPDCYSLDGVRPASDAEHKQNDVCATCQHAAWGSKINDNGREGKACADHKRLAVVAADDPSGAVYLLQVTAAALKGLSQYQRELSSRNIPPEIVRTRLAFDSTVSFPKLTFKFQDFIDEDAQNAITPLFGADKVTAITGQAMEGSAAIQQIEAQPVPAPTPPPAPPPPPPPAPAKKGFGSKPAANAPMAHAVTSQPVPVKTATKKDAPVPQVDSSSLSAEIDELLNNMDKDDPAS